MAQRMKRGDQINWNQVFYFSEIAAAGSVKAAAEKLGLSPSTLSEHLSQLEADLHVQLFLRQHRQLKLTDEGARLFHSARQMFESGKRFIDLISPTPLGCYPIAIGLVPGPSYAFAHGTIRDYLKRHRDVSARVLRYQHDELETALLESELDFGFTDRPSERKDLVQSPVVASELGFFVSAELTGQELRELFGELPLAICRAERRTRSVVEEVLDALDLSPRNVIASEYPSLVESLCRSGAAVAVLGRAHFERDAGVRMIQLPGSFPSLSEKLYATWPAAGENAEAIKRLKPLLPAFA